MKLSANAVKVIKVLRQKGVILDLTAEDVAIVTGLSVRQVVAIFNSLIRKGLGVRQELNGKKILRLTEDGMTVDLSVDDEE